MILSAVYSASKVDHGSTASGGSNLDNISTAGFANPDIGAGPIQFTDAVLIFPLDLNTNRQLKLPRNLVDLCIYHRSWVRKLMLYASQRFSEKDTLPLDPSKGKSTA